MIKPRTEKSQKDQATRVREKAEVFTPSWICNKQNNLVDNAWFNKENVFNVEHDKTWDATTSPIQFSVASGKTWEDYVQNVRLEISCGEAPYLVSRYDTVSGEAIDLKQRIGILDRKLRVVSENTTTEDAWLYWAMEAFKSTYGYDWQGDNVLLARENMLLTFVDYYSNRFNKTPETILLCNVAEILSWNVWQMDGLRYVIPDSCQSHEMQQLTSFGHESVKYKCEGCTFSNPHLHTGIYCVIKDWKNNQIVKFASLLKK